MAKYHPVTVYTDPTAEAPSRWMLKLQADPASAVSLLCGTFIEAVPAPTEIPDHEPDGPYKQAINRSPCPGVGEKAYGFYATTGGHTQVAQGRIREIYRFPFLLFVKPEYEYDERHMFYPVRRPDMIELQKSYDDGSQIGKFGWGFWYRPDGKVTFGRGRILQIFRNADMAWVDVGQMRRSDRPTNDAIIYDIPFVPTMRFRKMEN